MAPPVIDWADTKVIYIPKSYLTLVQSTPTEIYDLPLNAFRLDLLDLQDDPEGRPWQKTYRHNTEVSLGGLTYARTFEILEPYTITFEDGQYAVNLTGANSNVGDRVNVNQVSVRSQNSAGMTSSPDVEYASYNGGVTYNKLSPYSGTAHPTGTPRQHVNNLYDAYLISMTRGLVLGYIIGDLVLNNDELRDSNGDPITLDGYTFKGMSKDRTTITIENDPVVQNCTYFNAKMTGYLDARNKLYNCLVENLTYIEGYIETCVLSGIGKMVLSGGATSYFLGCYGGTSQPATIDMGGTGQDLIMEEMWGEVQIENMTGISDTVYVQLGSGSIRVDLTSVTAGTIMVGGVGKLLDAADDSYLQSGVYHDGDLTIINDTVGEALEMLRYIERRVFIDTKALTNGDGSQRYPFKVQQDAADYAEDNNIRTLVVRGDILLDRQFKNFTIEGIGNPTIDTNGQDLTGTEFYHCQMEGSYTGFIKCFNCILKNGFSLNGGFNGCGTMQTLFALDNVIMNDCFNAHAGFYHTIISANVGSITNLAINGNKGRLTITGADHINDEIYVGMNEGHLIFDNTCLLGNMVATGDCDFDNETGRDDIIDRTSPEVHKINLYNEEIEAGYTFKETLKVVGAMLGGKISGAGTTTITVRNMGDTKDVVVAGVDENGNRVSVTLDVS